MRTCRGPRPVGRGPRDGQALASWRESSWPGLPPSSAVGTCAVSRAVSAHRPATVAAPAVSSATGTQPLGPSPTIAAAISGEKPPSANPICVPIAMPE